MEATKDILDKIKNDVFNDSRVCTAPESHDICPLVASSSLLV